MHIRCPHCHNAIEIVEDSSFKDVECPSCGSHFNLVAGDAPTASGPTKPRRLAHFELIERLGVGHFGTVWKAKDTHLDRFVAVKIPRSEQLDEVDIEKFFREARAAAQLRHPNIVAVHEVGREGNTIFIASDYVEGATLGEWLGGRPLPPREAAGLCAKIADALHSAHEAGVVHRDLKPGNIMMDMNGESHIMDFGLAKRDSGEITMTIEGALLGTPAYMPPEQAAGKGHDADRRSDVYSLGVILFEMLTGELPFRGEKRMLLIHIQREEPSSPRVLNAIVPRDLETICLKCLEKSPEKRYQSAVDLADELRRFLDGKPIKARRIGKLAKGWRWAKRNRTVASLAATVVLVLIAGIATTSYWAKTASDRSRQAVNSLVSALASAHPSTVPAAIEAIMPFRETALPLLRREFEAADGLRRLHVACGLAECGQVERPFLLESVVAAPTGECDNISLALAHDRESALEDIKTEAEAATSRQDWKLKTRLATIALYLQDTTIAADMLQGVPADKQDEQRRPNWQDPPLDSNWTPPEDATKTAISAAHGLLEDRFAFCQDMPWDKFLTTIETLRRSGYRPTRVRPFVHSGQRLVAAVWTRGSGRWQLETDLAAEELPSPESAAEKDGLAPADVAAYPGQNDAARYCVVWSQPTTEGEQRRIRAAITEDDWEAASAQMARAGLSSQTTLHASVSADGTRRYAGIWSNQQASTGVDPASAPPPKRASPRIWEDISVVATGKPPHPLDVLRRQLAALALMPAPQQDTPENRLLRGKAHYYLDQPQEALGDLDFLAAQSPPNATALWYGALCRAQLGQAEEAGAAMAKLAGMEQSASWSSYGQILVHAWLGDMKEAKRDFDQLVMNIGTDAGATYGAACLAAQCVRIVKGKSATETTAWKQDALGLVRMAYTFWYMGSQGIENDPDFAPLYDDASFQALVIELTERRSYTSVWRYANDYESLPDTDRTPEEQQQAALDRAADDFRPVAVAVRALPDQSALRATLIWRRPKIPVPDWDPVQRTMFVEHFPTWSGRVEKLVDVLTDCDNTSLRSNMCLAIGSIHEPSADAKKSWPALWTEWYVRQSDAGTHSASGWALRNWDAPLPEVPEQSCNDQCNWRLTETGLTMIRIPVGEVHGAAEDSVRIRIRNAFWLSDREVTEDQFWAFLTDQSYQFETPDHSDEAAPATDSAKRFPMRCVSWYDAVMFCNWLSRRERRAPCYVKEGKEQMPAYFNASKEYDAWKLLPGADGYRLPTQDEWEYACRACTPTTFCFGDTEDLLDRYAVFVKNGIGSPNVVGSKLCNAWGLFDMHGNVSEWCQESWEERSDRVHRGGGWDDPADRCRSAAFGWSPPNQRGYPNGFRVALDVAEKVEPTKEAK